MLVLFRLLMWDFLHLRLRKKLNPIEMWIPTRSVPAVDVRVFFFIIRYRPYIAERVEYGPKTLPYLRAFCWVSIMRYLARGRASDDID